MTNKKSPFLLMILDGVGLGPDYEYNALKVAKTPCLDNFFDKYPNSSLEASGEAVGLPSGLMGNSEVGHLNIGAGRIVYQDIVLINKEISNKGFKENKEINNLYGSVLKHNGVLHLFGLFSDGGVHSSYNHLKNIIKNAMDKGIEKISLHLIFDGRDVPPKSGLDFYKNFAKENNFPGLQISSVMGRFWAMDRDNRWERIESAFKAITFRESDFQVFDDPISAIEDAYLKGETDEFIKPRLIKNGYKINDKDAIFCFNFRADRVREITMAFMDTNFNKFDISKRPKNLNYLCLTEYKEDFNLPVAYPPRKIENTISEVISKNKLSQLKIAETEKYPHITFFFNGGEEVQVKNENRILIPSPRDVLTYDKKPEMSARLVTERLLNEIKEEKYDVIILNFANGDMVGHTGILEAAVEAMEVVDECVKKISDSILSRNGEILIIADHGNCEEMLSKDGQPHTAHTTNKVPVIFVSNDKSIKEIKSGSLCDVAPTIINRLGIEKPTQMTGKSLI